MLVEKIKLYENREDVTLTTYVLDDSHEMLGGKTRPAILVCPGGAYAFCSDREAEPIALKYASMGYHAFVLRYSVYNKGKFINPMEENLPLDEDSLFPNAMCDIGAAMLYIKDHAEEWLVDKDKIILTGFSAGAHNSAMFCTHWDGEILAKRFGRDKEDLRPAGAILGYGYYDWVVFRDMEVPDLMARKMNEAIDFSYFGTRHPSKEQLAEASPAFHVTENCPPMFLWNTIDDNTLPAEQTVIMALALAKAKIPYEVHTFGIGDHGLSTCDEASASNMEQVNANVGQWLPLANDWLRRNFPLDLPEKAQPFSFDML